MPVRIREEGVCWGQTGSSCLLGGGQVGRENSESGYQGGEESVVGAV